MRAAASRGADLLDRPFDRVGAVRRRPSSPSRSRDRRTSAPAPHRRAAPRDRSADRPRRTGRTGRSARACARAPARRAAISAASEAPTDDCRPDRRRPVPPRPTVARTASSQSRCVSSTVCPRSPPGKPGRDGTITVRLSASRSRNGIQRGRPPRPARKPSFGPAALAPDAGGEAVDVDGRGFGFAHPGSPMLPVEGTGAGRNRRLRETAGPPRRPGGAYSAASLGRKAGTSARCARPIGCGHQRSSHSREHVLAASASPSRRTASCCSPAELPCSCCRTATAASGGRRSGCVATSRNCSVTSSGEPMMT